MLACPRCRTRLARRPTAWGAIHVCPVCRGLAAGLHVLRKERVAQDFIADAWAKARSPAVPGGKRCPHCGRPMALISARTREGDLDLDVCPRCAAVWFDPGEHAAIPMEGLNEAVSSADARMRDALEADFESQVAAPGPSEGPHAFQYVIGLLGLPVEFDAPVVRSRPWVTWGAAGVAAIVFFGALAAGGILGVVRMNLVWGFIPAEWGRRGGLTLITSFFLHAGLFHVLGNLYFLVVFGDNVEDNLGWRRYAALLLVAHVVGVAAHGLLDPRGGVPLVGASAGISGVIAYYALAFPRARLGLLFFFVFWLRLPAYVWLVLWVALQALTASSQLEGATNVSAVAHLAGAGVGAAAALYVRRRRREALDLAGVRRRPYDRTSGAPERRPPGSPGGQ